MMIGRPTVIRRRPLLRAAAIGGTFAAGRAAGRRASEGQAYPGASAGPGAAAAGDTAAQAAPGQEKDAGASTPVSDQLNQLMVMHDQGVLTDEEFAAAKAKVLGG